jgi:hypothetical protein
VSNLITMLKKGSLEIQYETNNPTLFCDGSVLTRMAPRSAGINIRNAAYPRPMARCDANVTPSQIVRTERFKVKLKLSTRGTTYSRQLRLRIPAVWSEGG